MKNLNLFDNILIEENRKIRKWPLNETEKDYKKNKEGFMNLFEQIYNDNQDVEEVAFKCVSNALGPDLMKALTIITHDVRDHIVVIIRKVPEDADFNELFSTIHSNAMDSGLFDDVAWETDGDEETTMFLNFIKAEKTWDGRDFTGTDVVPGEDDFDECSKIKKNRMTEANGHEITSEGFASFLKKNGFKFFKSGTIENQNDIDVYEGSGNFKELLNEYTDDGTRSFSCTTVDNGTYWYVSSVYTSDESLSDALYDNDDDVIADKIDYQVVCYGNSHGYSLDDLYNLSYTENKMDSDADGFASFLTKNGFKLYKANTTENQNDFDVYEGKGDKSFLSLLNEYSDGDDGIRDFACAKGWPIGDWTCWYISSAYSKDEDLSNALKGNSDDDDVKIDYMVYY